MAAAPAPVDAAVPPSSNKTADSSSSPSTSSAHPFWFTQPVPESPAYPTPVPVADPEREAEGAETVAATLSQSSLSSSSPVVEGEIDPNYPVIYTAYPLPSGFEWCDLDILSSEDLSAAYQLLSAHYVQDSSHISRFDYSQNFLQWALTSPLWMKQYHIGVRISASRKLIAFVSGTKQTIRINAHTAPMLEINFLCIHAKLRNNRLAPVLIKEITRRVNVEHIMRHAVYTAGVLIPTPVASATYYHRPLSTKKLIQVGFLPTPKVSPNTPENVTAAINRLVKVHTLPQQAAVTDIRPMTVADVPAVHQLLTQDLAQYKLCPVYTEEEVQHWFVPREGIVYSYVLYEGKELTMFLSWYEVARTFSTSHKIRTAHCFYIITHSSVHTLNSAARTALILARDAGFDVFTVLNIMDNATFVQEQKFLPGNGLLHYYLFNYRCAELQPKQVGLIIL